MATCYDNVIRVLARLELAEWVKITRRDADQVWGWPIGPFLERHVRDTNWFHDPRVAAEHFHAREASAYREPDGPTPALHIIFFPGPDGYRFAGMHLDKCAPVDVVGAVGHLIEVVHNMRMGETTDQDAIARLLDQRFEHAG
jgi:hypothetical protein